ncbi:MAG: molybdenum cofactor guanylyltransferase [Candidatus Aminicenantes bacterium]|nr:molybdenum cofactor guanylyltransferase [Candidatus Aminicenantes bacterium]
MKRKIRCGGKPMTAIVLAGGRGLRMKADKAGLPVGGRTLLEHVLGQLEPHFSEILISVSPGQKIRFAAGRTVEDGIPGQGPLGGILAGLKAAASDACAVVACDIPDVNIPLLRSLARAGGDAEIAVPIGPAGHFEPLFAVYRKSVVPDVEALLQAGERSVIPLFGRCRTTVLRIEDMAWLRNLNTRMDYESYVQSLAARQARSPRGGMSKGRIRTGVGTRPRKKGPGAQRPGRARRP